MQHQNHNFVLGYCILCLYPKIESEESLEKYKDAMYLVDELRGSTGMSENDAIRQIHNKICEPSLRAGECGKGGLP